MRDCWTQSLLTQANNLPGISYKARAYTAPADDSDSATEVSTGSKP